MFMEKNVWIGEGNMQTLGVLYTPATSVRGMILFCPPLFEERKSSARAMAETARAFCEKGWAVLRFDYRGCGDSPGAFDEYSVSDWKVDIRNAGRFLAQTLGPVPFGVLGLRMGGTLAVSALTEAWGEHEPPVDFLVLWEPVTEGKLHLEQELRKKLTKEMLTFGKSRKTRTALIESLERGETLDFDGYPISSSLYREMQKLHMEKDLEQLRKASLLLFHVANQNHLSPALERLFLAAKSNGFAVEQRVAKLPPFWNLIGLTDITPLADETILWVSQLPISNANP